MSTKPTTQEDIYELSDEEFGNLSIPVMDSEQEETEESPEDSQEVHDDLGESSDNTGNSEDNLDHGSDDANEPDEGQEGEGDIDPAEGVAEAGFTFDVKQAQETLTKIFSPFKANGKEIQVKDVDDVISLMQMGANYNKKMASIKPFMGHLKMLQKNNLLDEAEISYLIDLKNKDPKAIAKLLQDSEIDLYNFDTEQANDYLPNNHAVSQEELALDEALQEIQHSPQYQRTVQTLGVQWDVSSREKVAKNPQIIGVINQHMENGLYDFVWNEVERQRILGYLKGVDDLDAYYQVGEALNKAGKLQNPNQSEQQRQNLQIQQQVREQEQRKKKLAASTTGKGAAKPQDKLDILAMSDEEFEKIGKSHLM